MKFARELACGQARLWENAFGNTAFARWLGMRARGNRVGHA
jgi:hypothetical protein